MIKSCRDKETEKLLNRVPSRKFAAVQTRAEERLVQLHAAVSLEDLSLPSMRLKKLHSDREGQYSIRIRICFEWRDGNAYQVEVVDYH